MGELGKRFVAAMVSAKSAEAISQRQLQEDHFNDSGLKVFQAFKQYYDQYKQVPTFAHIFDLTGITLSPVDDNPDHVADLVYKRHLLLNFHEMMQEAQEALEERDVEKLYKVVESTLATNRPPKAIRLVSQKDNVLERYEKLISKETPEFNGLKSPWPVLDYQTGGFLPGSFNVFSALSNMGKTWVACILANHFYRNDKNVLLVSLEMPKIQIQRRLDCLYSEVSYTNVFNKNLTDYQKDRLKTKLEELQDKPNEIFLADKQEISTVSDVYQYFQAKKPDVIIVDGGYRFEGTSNVKWESAASIVREIQISAEKSNVPWIVTTQHGDGQNEEKKSAKAKPTAYGIKYAKEWHLDANLNIVLHQDKALRAVRLMELHIKKITHGAGTRLEEPIQINWDFQQMKFTEYDEQEEQQNLPEPEGLLEY